MPQIKLSFQPSKGYKKSVGFHVGKDGAARKQKVFYLGHDKATAGFLAERITDIWKRLKASGSDIWTDAGLAEVNELRQQSDRGNIKPELKAIDNIDPTNHVPGMASTPASTIRTSHQAIQAYRADVASNPRISDGYKVNLHSMLDDIMANVPDIPLTCFGHAELTELIRHYINRPMSRKTNRRISADTAHNHIRAAKNLLAWLEETDQWPGFKRWEKHFKISKLELMTEDEKDEADDKDFTFTIKELATLYKAASRNNRLQMLMLIALNTAMTQGEIATLKRRHFLVIRSRIISRGEVIEPGEFWLTKVRKKVKGKSQRGRWRLWPETETMIADHWMWQRNKQTNYDDADYLLLSRTGKPLVWYKRGDGTVLGQRLDSVQQTWDRLLNRTPSVRRLPFKHLRKTSSQLVRDIGGKEMSEIHLVHTDKTMGRAYNKGDYVRLGEVLVEVRKMLNPLFDP